MNQRYSIFWFIVLILSPFFVCGQYVLYPPLNLHAGPVECLARLEWELPQLLGGGLPDGLLGYVIYRNGDSIAAVDTPSTLEFYDPDPGPCNPEWVYQVTALYDLSYYGFPGQMDQSDPTPGDTVKIVCDRPWPFIENWDQGTFAYHDWKFDPSQGNWSVYSLMGNPAPSAEFRCVPAFSGYSFSLVTPWMGVGKTDGYFDMWAEFDLKLENINNTGAEKLTLDAFPCIAPSQQIFAVDNMQSFDWNHYKISLNDFRGSAFSLAFTASGANSGDIERWLLDNINIYSTCRAPREPSATVDGNLVLLTWHKPLYDGRTPPSGALTGYFVYRSDINGVPPFTQMTPLHVPDTTFTDTISGVTYPATYRYYITAYFTDPETQIQVCLSASSDTVTAELLAEPELHPQSLAPRPNPSTGKFTIDLPRDAGRIRILDCRGMTVRDFGTSGIKGRGLEIDLEGISPGIYFIEAETSRGKAFGKVLIR